MSLFSYIHRLDKNHLYIPTHIRSNLGWYDGLSLFVSSISSGWENDKLANELLVTTVAPQRRLDIWRLQVSFWDRPGLITELTELLQRQNIDIVTCKASTVDQNRFLNVEFEIDCQLYSNVFDGDSASRKKKKFVYLDELKTLIVAEFIRDVIFVSSDDFRPIAKIKRNLPLFRSCNELSKYVSATLREGFIELPLPLLEEIRKTFEYRYPDIESARNADRLPLVSVVADVECYVIRLFIFYPNTGHLHVRVVAKNEVGSLSSVSRLINECGMNINQVFNRPVRDGQVSLTDFFVHYTNPNNSFNDVVLKEILKRNFAKSPLKSHLGLEITFPKTISKKRI